MTGLTLLGRMSDGWAKWEEWKSKPVNKEQSRQAYSNKVKGMTVAGLERGLENRRDFRNKKTLKQSIVNAARLWLRDRDECRQGCPARIDRPVLSAGLCKGLENASH